MDETRALLDRYLAAQEARDLDALMACWHADADGIHPLRPDRSWFGRDACRELWARMWVNDPAGSFRVMTAVVDGDVIVVESLMEFGDGTVVPGVNVFEVEDGRFRHLRVYTDVPQRDGVGISEFLDEHGA